jgi:hypothetical protein
MKNIMKFFKAGARRTETERRSWRSAFWDALAVVRKVLFDNTKSIQALAGRLAAARQRLESRARVPRMGS